jgi:menaquinol-cytochrome c reductase iron-sulfur subunit
MASSMPWRTTGVRRRALAWSSVGLAGLLGLAYMAAGLRFVIPPGEKPSAKGISGENVGPASGFKTEVPTRVPLDVDAQGRPQGGGWLIKHADGTFTAFDMHCTHLYCPYEWSSPGGTEGVFACPCHGSVFRKDGSVERGPAFIPLRTRRVTVSEGNVLVGGIGTSPDSAA